MWPGTTLHNVLGEERGCWWLERPCQGTPVSPGAGGRDASLVPLQPVHRSSMGPDKETRGGARFRNITCKFLILPFTNSVPCASVS